MKIFIEIDPQLLLLVLLSLEAARRYNGLPH